MARKLSIQLAINEALAQEMERDPTVVLLGEDIAGGSGGDGEVDAWGGPMGTTKGLKGKFPDRVLDTPITESGFIGAAVGAAASGLRPVAELMFIDFMGVCFDQIFNQAAKFRYMFGGKAVTPVVIRTMYGAGLRTASQHSQALYPLFTHIPGLKVVLPSNAYDAKGLLIQAIRDDDPVIFCEHKFLYRRLKEDVPEDDYIVPIGQAAVKREGHDLTMVSYAAMLHTCLQAAEQLEQEDGLDCEVIDLRTLLPLDKQTIVNSLKKTHKLLVVHEHVRTGGIAGEIAAVVMEEAFDELDAPVARVTSLDTPVPYSPPLEEFFLPNAEKVVKAARQLAAH